MDLMQSLLLSALTGGASALVTVVALKVDVRWIKQILQEHAERLRTLEATTKS
jgi:hypothetical protein